jgi:hypothetical protein
MRTWKQKQLLGFSVKSMKELERVAKFKMHGVNTVELKLEKFAEKGDPLYFYTNGEFIINESVVERIVAITKPLGIEVHFHLPIERLVNKDLDVGINIGILSHHEVAIKRMRMFEEMYRKYGIGRILVMHPPTVSYRGKKVSTEKLMLENSRIYFETLDAIRIAENHQTLIGVENQTDKKLVAGMVGYLPRHFKTMLRNTRTIGLTLDVGHRRLTKHFRVRDYLALGIPIVKIHFHGNSANFRKEDFDDDEHLPANADNVYGYKNFLRFFRRNRPSITMEIADLFSFSDDELLAHLINFCAELA